MGLVHHPNVVTDGLIGCWDAGNRRSYPTTGTTWTDLADGNNSTLVNGGSGLTFDSANGGSIVFDGTNDYTTATNFDNVSPVSGTNSFAFSMWIYLDNTNPITFITQRVDNNNRWSWWWNASNQMFFQSLASGSSEGTSGAYVHSFTADNWYHLALVRDGNTILFYIDSVLKYSASFTGSITAKAAGLNFGYDQQNYASLNGKIALVHAYNKALTAAEIKQNYEVMKPRFKPRITKSGMFASWDAGDPASYAGGTTLKDTANHYDGTFVNNGSGGDVSFDSANGGSLVFDGTSDYVNITTLPNCSSLARSAIIWLSVDDWSTAWSPTFTPFQSAADQFNISFGVVNSSMYFNGGGSTRSTAERIVALSPVPSDGEWICWAMTIDSSGNVVAMYRNAVALSETGNTGGFTIKTGTTIGCRLNSSTVENPLEGKVGSLRLYTKTLSAAEIMDNFQKTRGRFGV